MKTKVLATVLLTSVLGTGLYASCGMQGQGMKKGMQNKSEKCQMMKKHHGKKAFKGKFIITSVLNKLNLTAEQKTEIMKIKEESKGNITTLEDAFTKESFDKGKFIEIMKQKRENMLKSRADKLEKIYNVLTVEQKEQFKVLLDLQKEKRAAMKNKIAKGMKFDKNCNGGR